MCIKIHSLKWGRGATLHISTLLTYLTHAKSQTLRYVLIWRNATEVRAIACINDSVVLRYLKPTHQGQYYF